MAYLTLDDAISISRHTRLTGIDLSEPVYFHDITIFSKHERKQLLSMMELMRNPKYFFAVLYFPVQGMDSQQFIYEPGAYRYHDDQNCTEQEPDKQKYLIPPAIREKGNSAVRTYRRWFKSVRHFLDQGKVEIFLAHLKAKWDITVLPSEIIMVNGEYTDAYAQDLHKLESRIDQLVKSIELYREQTEIHRDVLDKFGKATFLAYTPSRIRNNDTGHDDKTVKDILNTFDNTFKKPLRQCLFEYYCLLFNPELYFDAKLLNRAGLDKCTHCHRADYRRPDQKGQEANVRYEDILYLRSMNWKWEDVSGLN